MQPVVFRRLWHALLRIGVANSELPETGLVVFCNVTLYLLSIMDVFLNLTCLPAILPIMAELVLCQRRKDHEATATDQLQAGTKTDSNREEIAKIFLSDLVLLLNHNKDNRR